MARTIAQETANLIINEVMRWKKKGHPLPDPVLFAGVVQGKVDGTIAPKYAKFLIAWLMGAASTPVSSNGRTGGSEPPD
jgi:hypothetical protein